MITTNTPTVPEREIDEILGVVRGNTVRARNVGRDITQFLRNIIGGELKAYSELMTESRNEAYKRMQEEAEKMDADAIVNIRFMTSQISSGGAEMLAYGTAVRLK